MSTVCASEVTGDYGVCVCVVRIIVLVCGWVGKLCVLA